MTRSKTFWMTRQEVRRQFQRLFCHVYVEALEMILMTENAFGTRLRNCAIEIGKENHETKREIMNRGFESAHDFPRK